MATSNSKSSLFLVATFVTFFLLLLSKVNSSDQLSFTFNKFTPNQNGLIFQGDASATSAGVLQLSKVKNNQPVTNSTGRVVYAAPVNIWDSANDKVASFVTSFTFVITAPNPSKTADGLTFFLVPYDSELPSDSGGGYFGVFGSSSKQNAVAVEFDTYRNPWDPKDAAQQRHIGIDVNSNISNKTVSWNWRNGEVAVVQINYLAPTKTLVVSLTYPSDQTSFALSAFVDLKETLPEWVRVGLSGASGQATNGDIIETHEVRSWSFSSTFKATSATAKETIMDKVLNLGPKRYRRPKRKGFGSSRNRIATEIVAASTAYTRNSPKYQGFRSFRNATETVF